MPVMIRMMVFDSTSPPRLAETTAPEPLSIMPMTNINWNAPMNAKSMPTLRPYLATNTSAVVIARNRRMIGAISQ